MLLIFIKKKRNINDSAKYEQIKICYLDSFANFFLKKCVSLTLLLRGLMVFLREKSVIYKTKMAKINTTYKLIFFIKNLERAIAPKANEWLHPWS